MRGQRDRSHVSWANVGPTAAICDDLFAVTYRTPASTMMEAGPPSLDVRCSAGADSLSQRAVRDPRWLPRHFPGLTVTRWVPEYGREYTIRLFAKTRALAALDDKPPPSLEDLIWPSADFERIAARQNELETAEARCGGPVLVCDMDAFATVIWGRQLRVAAALEQVDNLLRGWRMLDSPAR